MNSSSASSVPIRPASPGRPPSARFSDPDLSDSIVDSSTRHRVGSGRALAPPVRLQERDRAAALEHFLRLSQADRHLRFLQVMSDQAIDAYVANIDFVNAMCFGVFDADGTLVACGEGLPYGAGDRLFAEAAFSTDEAWRRHGLARMLCEALGAYATSVGIERVILHCHRRNAPMRGLLRAIHAVTTFDEGDLEAEWDPKLP